MAVAGRMTQMGQITAAYSKAHWAVGPDGPQARLMFDGAIVSPAGAAFAGAFAIDGIDAHDSHSPVKGHAGSGVFPALLAFAQAQTSQPLSGPAFLSAMTVGYEVSYRAGLTQHATCADYHTSAAWAHPAIDAAAELMAQHGLHPIDTQSVRINTFHNATRQARASRIEQTVAGLERNTTVHPLLDLICEPLK